MKQVTNLSNKLQDYLLSLDTNSSAVLVAYCMIGKASYCIHDTEPTCSISLKEIGDAIDMHRSTVGKAIKQLREVGFLSYFTDKRPRTYLLDGVRAIPLPSDHPNYDVPECYTAWVPAGCIISVTIEEYKEHNAPTNKEVSDE